MRATENHSSTSPLNWTAIAALYAALGLSLIWMLYWGDYRNAAWLVLLGVGGGLTAVGRVKETADKDREARRWKRAGGLTYAVFFVWAGTVLIRIWMSG
jgi:hypothetical protein